jgi:hypothetical protein
MLDLGPVFARADLGGREDDGMEPVFSMVRGRLIAQEGWSTYGTLSFPMN